MDGWIYEGPDTSVGIFGESWFHADCPNEPTGFDGEGLPECEVDTSLVGGVGAGMDHESRWAYRVHCLDCGRAIRWVESEWDPIYGEDQ
jgi:hypothetical protein